MRPQIDACYKNFQKGFETVENLFVIHSTITGGVRGRNNNLTPSLLKSSIVFICGSWETFIEDLCRVSIGVITSETEESNRIPNGIREKVSRNLLKAANPIDLWKLSGTAWKDLLRAQVEILCDGSSGGLNTPKYRNVKEILKTVTGVNDIKTSWAWQGMTPDAAVKKLNKIIELRGDIAHGKQTPGINVQICKGYSYHIERLAYHTHIAIDRQIDKLMQ